MKPTGEGNEMSEKIAKPAGPSPVAWRRIIASRPPQNPNDRDNYFHGNHLIDGQGRNFIAVKHDNGYTDWAEVHRWDPGFTPTSHEVVFSSQPIEHGRPIKIDTVSIMYHRDDLRVVVAGHDVAPGPSESRSYIHTFDVVGVFTRREQNP